MNFKKTIFISILLLFLSVAAVSAADLDNNYGNESFNVDDSFLVTGDIVGDSLSSTPGTFGDLQSEINNAPTGSVLFLSRDYNGATNSRVNLNKDLTIDGQGHTIDCLGKENCFAFYSKSGTITLKNLIIKNGYNKDTDKGGAIYSIDSSRYVIDNCTFINNYAEDYGGAIYSEYYVTVLGSVFSGNAAGYNGGAIYAHDADVFADNCTFIKNTAFLSGGAIFADNIYINHIQKDHSSFNSFFINNVAETYSGGAIITNDRADMRKNKIVAVNTIFSGNYAKLNGGAIY